MVNERIVFTTEVPQVKVNANLCYCQQKQKIITLMIAYARVNNFETRNKS